MTFELRSTRLVAIALPLCLLSVASVAAPADVDSATKSTSKSTNTIAYATYESCDATKFDAACDDGGTVLLAVPAEWGPAELDLTAECVDFLTAVESVGITWWPTDPYYCVGLVGDAFDAANAKGSPYDTPDDYLWEDLSIFVPSHASVDWECRSASGSVISSGTCESSGIFPGPRIQVATCVAQQAESCLIGTDNQLVVTDFDE